MQAEAQTGGISTKMLWTGRILSAVPVLLVAFGAIVKWMKAPGVAEGFAHAGLPERLMVPIGLLESICVVVYVIPRTAVLGAILLTGLLGGACVTNLRIGDPSSPLPVGLGMLAWGGLFLHDERLRALIPLRRA